MAKIVLGSNAPEDGITLNLSTGQFIEVGADGYDTNDRSLVGLLGSEVVKGWVKFEGDFEDAPADDEPTKAEEKERKQAARTRSREIKSGKDSGDELTPVPGTPQGDPDAADSQEGNK